MIKPCTAINRMEKIVKVYDLIKAVKMICENEKVKVTAILYNVLTGFQ